MNRYLIRTDREENKTQILKLGNPVERIGLIYTDFILRPGTRDITKEEIVDPETSKSIGQVRLYRKDDLIVVRFGGKDVVVIDREGTYTENGEKIPLDKDLWDVIKSQQNIRAYCSNSSCSEIRGPCVLR